MMNRGKTFLATTLLAAAAFTPFSGPLRAVTYAEIGDAGQTLVTAQDTAVYNTPDFGQPLTGISGNLTGAGADADLFMIQITNPSTFSVSTVGGSALDTYLCLFDEQGNAVLANDDANGTSLQSTLPAGNSTLASLTTGVYYLAISLSGDEPVNLANQLLFAPGADTTALRTAAGGLNPTTLDDYNGNVSFAETGAYNLVLTGAAAVPEPSTWATALLSASALAGVSYLRRRRLAS